MPKFERIIQELQTFENNINFIESNLSLDTATIINKLQHKNNLSRKGIDESFKKYYKSKDGYDETLSTYIKRRKNNFNKIRRSKINQVEEKYNTDELLQKAIKLAIIDKYGFCNIDMDKNKVYINSYNKKKILESTFKDEIYLYFDFGEDHTYSINEIIRFNEAHILNNDVDGSKTLFREYKFKNFFTENVLKINGINYHMGTRSFIFNNLKELDGYGSWLKLDEDFSSYRTILSHTREFLTTLMNINNGSIDCEDKDIINSNEYTLSIKCEDDVNYHYKKSLEYIRKNISFDQAIVFNEILNIENKKTKDRKLSDLYFGLSKAIGTTSYEFYQDALLWLLINGYIYMK